MMPFVRVIKKAYHGFVCIVGLVLTKCYEPLQKLRVSLWPCKTGDLHRRAAYSICESWFLIYQDVYHDLFVCS